MKDAIQHMFRTKAEKVLQDQAEGRTEELTGTFKPSPWNENEKKKKKKKKKITNFFHLPIKLSKSKFTVCYTVFKHKKVSDF